MTKATINYIELNSGEVLKFNEGFYRNYLLSKDRKVDERALDVNHTGLKPVAEYLTDEFVPFWIAKEIKYSDLDFEDAYDEVMKEGNVYFPIKIEIVDNKGRNRVTLKASDLLDMAGYEVHSKYYAYVQELFGF